MSAEKLQLDGRVAVVTGGGQGIDLSCAQALDEFGAVVVLADIDLGVAERGRSTLAGAGIAAEAAVHQLTQSIGAEWADHGVQVNAVAPTYIEAPMTGHAAASGLIDHRLRYTPMGRLGRVDEIASVVHFLASDASSLMTGTTAVADAGFTCW